ncbi:MAG: PTS glucose transporter subunit IIA [Erysipelotrichaceae bacterium]|nr:PTS glucose transporter subunit IIA [Erysipelotrichaceae bacterium]
MFDFFKKKPVYEPLNLDNDKISSLGDGKLIPIESVSDEMFAQKMLGDSIAFKFAGNGVNIFSPVNGTLTVMFPTGHAFGLTTKDGIEVLVHIGVDTVENKGVGFKILEKKQGDEVKAGDPIVAVDFDKLSAKFDMSTMLIITNPNEKKVELVREGEVKRDSIVGTIS